MSWLEVRNLKVEFHNQAQVTQAVKGITFAVEEGEIVGLVGESGSGKSSAALALLGLLPETARVTVEKIKAGEIDVVPFTGSKKGEGAYEKALRLIREENCHDLPGSGCVSGSGHEDWEADNRDHSRVQKVYGS